MRTLPATLALALLVAFGSAPGCVWIDEEDIALFNDRDQDGLDHGEDCDDSDKNIQDTVAYYPDVDGDGFGDAGAQPTRYCPGQAPAGMVTDNTDCNDNNPDARPGGVEVCDPQDFDEDCDGAADDADADAEGKVMWYADADGDQFGDVDDPGVSACDPPTGTEVQDHTDCDDTRAAVNPDGVEVCDPDNLDEDCSGAADDLDGNVDPSTLIQYYDDADGDGYGNPAVPGALQCDPPGGQADNNGDCNDADPAIHPGATEVCDPADVDEDCDAMADDADPSVDLATATLWYPDADGDGYGDMYAPASQSCDPGPTEVADGTDCDDARPDVHPYAAEVCDPGMVDEDCDGLANDLDPDAVQSDWWLDSDGDGYGVNGPPATTACIGPPDHVDQSGDCDDGDPTIHPGAKEYHDGIDSDCDPGATDWVCGQSYLRVGPAEVFTTIQSAVDAVDQVTYCDGDTIEVLPGTYIEDIVIADKSPNVVGLVGPATTVIQGTGAGRVVSIDRSGTRLAGFTITGGAVAGDGGGVRVFYGDGTVLDDLVVTGNSATNGGGVELRNPTNVSLLNSTITGNSTTTGDGGGIRVSAAGAAAGQTTLLSNLVVDNNSAGDRGGGIAIDLDHLSTTAVVVVEDTVVDANDAVTAGGLLAQDCPALEVRNVDITNNVAAANHGGAQLIDAVATLDGVTLQANTGVTVAAMQAQTYANGPVTLVDVVAVDNVLTQANGHGILLKGDETYGSVLQRVEVARTTRAAGAIWGGGLSVEGKVDATNLLVYDESGPSGIFLAESASGIAATHTLTNVTVAGCAGDGIGVGAAVAAGIDLVNVISAFNGGYGVNEQILPVAVGNSATWANALGGYSQSNPVGANGNIDADPMFVSYSAFTSSDTWDLSLQAGSPCIDAGNPAILDADGSVSDMGYYGGPGAP